MFAKPFISLIIWMALLAFLSTCIMWSLEDLMKGTKGDNCKFADDGTKDKI
jgi:hypothetical protein